MSNVLTRISKLNIRKAFGIHRDPSTKDLARVQAQKSELHSKLEELEKQETEIVSQLREGILFEQILPTKEHTSLHEQLTHNERVHPVSDIDELLKLRVGDECANKRCFARVMHGNNAGGEITAGIYTALVNVPSIDNGKILSSSIPGDITAIKNLPIERFTPPEEGSNQATVAVLYSISGNRKYEWEKGGRPLAGAVYEYLQTEAKERKYNLLISTLSPVRSFGNWLYKQEGFANLVDENGRILEQAGAYLKSSAGTDKIKGQVIRYLISEPDDVANFHLKNGAYIGDIKTTIENEQDWVMANYVYSADSTQLFRLKSLYQSTNTRALAPHLMKYLDYQPDLLEKSTCLFDGEDCVLPFQTYLA